MGQDQKPGCSRIDTEIAALRREVESLPVPKDTEALARRLQARLAIRDKPDGQQGKA
ncbi:MAG: hypothetical protein P3W94_009965 [Paracoccus sp. (in: a-proteobacteria)]|nr:hypothetical protein [Paracoccus sp. (in: a-proteobacteria)]